MPAKSKTALLRTAQGYAYEYATLGCLFDPLLSVQYYALGESHRGAHAARRQVLTLSARHSFSK